MSETRRAMVTIIQQGDPEIAGALVAGVMAARGNRDIERPENSPGDCFQRDGAGRPERTGNRNSPMDAQPAEAVEVVTVTADKWKRVARQVRVAIGNTKTPEDYRLMIIRARCEYAVHRHTGPAYTVARKLLLAWVMVCQAMRRAYRAQDRVLK